MQRAISVVVLSLAVALAAGCGALGKKETAQTQAPKTDMDYFNEGWALTQQQRHAEAEPLYRKALEINPNNATALNNLGWALAQQGKVSESVPFFEKALQIDPNFSLAQNNLNWARTQLSEPANPPQKAPGRN